MTSSLPAPCTVRREYAVLDSNARVLAPPAAVSRVDAALLAHPAKGIPRRWPAPAPVRVPPPRSPPPSVMPPVVTMPMVAATAPAASTSPAPPPPAPSTPSSPSSPSSSASKGFHQRTGGEHNDYKDYDDKHQTTHYILGIYFFVGS